MPDLGASRPLYPAAVYTLPDLDVLDAIMEGEQSGFIYARDGHPNADLLAEKWDDITPLRVRIALHTGTAEERDGDYFGPTLNRVARLLALAHGGQTLVSAVTRDLCRDFLPPAVSLSSRAACRGIGGAVTPVTHRDTFPRSVPP